MLDIGWKSFGNRWPCLEVVKNVSTPSVIFGSCCEIFGDLRKLSEIFDDLSFKLIIQKYLLSNEVSWANLNTY